MKGFFELLIGDEIHEYKGRGSVQGIAAGVLADSCGRSLTLTGTLTGGYSSTLFHLLYRFSPAIRTEFGRSEEGRWIQRYGFEEHTIGKDDDESVEDGRFSRRRRYRKVVRERPGLAPAALFHLIGNSVFLRLSDVASGLPSYEEQILLSPMDSEPDSYGYTQRGAYDTLFEKLRKALADALAKGSRKLLSTYLQSLLAYPDGCTQGETVLDPDSQEGIDVLICHPRLVQTGLDLIDFPTIVWAETDYSVYVMRQASRRSWRIGQTRPVKVVFMAYRGTLQADALKLVAQKLQSSLAVEGELPEDGLAAYGDDGDDLMLALARKIVNGEEEEEESVEGCLRPGKGRRGRLRGAAGGRRLESRRSRAGGRCGQRKRSPRRHRAYGRACAGQRSHRQR